MSKAGEFEILVSDPYPCWIDIIYRGQTISRIRHGEMSDLHYAIEKAMREAKRKLCKDQDEV